MLMDDKTIREYLRKLLSWSEGHVDWKKALAGMPRASRGERPKGAPHSAWELLEHVRIAQWDILNFSRDPKHVSPDFPSGYWPATSAPPSDAAWEKSVKSFQSDMEAMGKLIADSKTDLAAPIPHGSGQTILREALLLADHNAYHLGQFVLVRRLLGNWQD
jgi:DinB superfamily